MLCYQILGFLIHQVILDGLYESVQNLWRSDPKTWIIWLTGLLWAVLFTFIYSKGLREKRSDGRGPLRIVDRSVHLGSHGFQPLFGITSSRFSSSTVVYLRDLAKHHLRNDARHGLQTYKSHYL